MSWEKPFDEELLKFVRYMKNNMSTQRQYGWFANNDRLEGYVSAYETVENYITKEMKLRSMVKHED